MIEENRVAKMGYPNEWQFTEDQFDQRNLIKPKETNIPSISGFCLDDFYIIQKWIDYAKGLQDPSCAIFENKPIKFDDIYKTAELRKAKFDKIFQISES